MKYKSRSAFKLLAVLVGVWVLLGLGHAGLARAVVPAFTLLGRLTGRRVLLTTATLRPLGMNRRISHALATKELGYEPRPLGETVLDTMQWFESQGYLP